MRDNVCPKILPEHKKTKYLYSDTISSNDNDVVASFIHDKKDGLPILMHMHDFYEINIILKGKGYHYIEAQSFEANEGSVYVIPPGIKHGYYTNDIEQFRLINILIRQSFINEYKYEFENIPGYEVLFEIEPQLRKNTAEESFFLSLNKKQFSETEPLLNLLLLNGNKDQSNFIFKKGILIALISKLSSFIQQNHNIIMNNTSEKYSIGSAFILKTIEYMNNNYSQKITIDDLASQASMSRSTFIRRFETLMKSPPLDYLILVRLKKACEMLANSNKSVSEISQECGFFDHSHFSKTFKLNYSLTPLQYRKEKRKML